MKPLFAIICVFLFGGTVNSQRLLVQRLKEADTILLISHKMTTRSTNSEVDSMGNLVVMPDLIVEGSLNNNIVIERKVLTEKQTTSLIAILTYTYKPSRMIVSSGCFDPHHSIIIRKGGKTSYIDLCFHCLDFETSADITGLQIKDDKWEKLFRFFRTLGFKYEMLGDE